MSPTTRKRQKNFIPHVLEAVKMLQGKDHGASTKNILKYLGDKLNDEMNGVKILPSPADGVVKSALREALSSGLLVHYSGVGLNGSFVLPLHSKGLKTKDMEDMKQQDKQKSVITKEAKLRTISSLANKLHESARLQKKPAKADSASKRRRITKLQLPVGDLESDKEDQFDTGENTTALKTILKLSRKRKFTGSKIKRKKVSRRVKFRSPPRVIFITPCIKRRSKRKKAE